MVFYMYEIRLNRSTKVEGAGSMSRPIGTLEKENLQNGPSEGHGIPVDAIFVMLIGAKEGLSTVCNYLDRASVPTLPS
jgi:hypothetical protein